MQHRYRLAEPEEQPRRGRTAKEQREALRKAFGLPHKEQREALRKAFGLPHYDGDYADYFRHLQGPKV